jgi:hypothetical protein
MQRCEGCAHRIKGARFSKIFWSPDAASGAAIVDSMQRLAVRIEIPIRKCNPLRFVAVSADGYGLSGEFSTSISRSASSDQERVRFVV